MCSNNVFVIKSLEQYKISKFKANNWHHNINASTPQSYVFFHGPMYSVLDTYLTHFKYQNKILNKMLRRQKLWTHCSQTYGRYEMFVLFGLVLDIFSLSLEHGQTGEVVLRQPFCQAVGPYLSIILSKRWCFLSYLTISQIQIGLTLMYLLLLK